MKELGPVAQTLDSAIQRLNNQGLERSWKQRARLARDAKKIKNKKIPLARAPALASHALPACEARVLRARKTLTPRFNDFFTDFEKKTDCFAVYPAGYQLKGSEVRVCQSDKTCSGNALELQRPEKVLDF